MAWHDVCGAGAAVIVVSSGMTMQLATRKITSRLYASETTHAVNEVHAADLVHGEAYCWDAGAQGSDDWRYEHTVRQHPDEDTNPGEAPCQRIAFIFRAIKPAHAREYRTSRWPYCIVGAKA